MCEPFVLASMLFVLHGAAEVKRFVPAAFGCHVLLDAGKERGFFTAHPVEQQAVDRCMHRLTLA